MAPMATSEPIHVLSSDVTGMLEFSAINLGSTGEVHPRFVPAIIRIKLAIENNKIL